MAEIVVMPRMNLTMESGLLACWYKEQGDAVTTGEALCSIENEKETEELLSPLSGVVVRRWAPAEEQYKVGAPLCLIAAEGEDVSALIEQAQGQIESGAQQEAPAPMDAPEPAPSPAGGGLRILPRTRNLARQNGVTVEELRAHFGDVLITEEHVRQHLEHRPAAAAGALSGQRVRMSPMRKAIAQNMALSAGRTARLTNFMEVDMTQAMNSLAERKQQGETLSVTALLIRACAAALREHGIVNTVLDEQQEEILFRDEVNIGFAVDVPEGLVVPVIRNADQKPAAEISREVAELARAAQDGALSHEQMAGGTFTVSNVGMFGVDSFTPLIRYPETAILGAGEIKTLPRYLDGDTSAVHPRRIMKMGLTYDHRVIDGAPASRFLQSVRMLLEGGTLF